MTQAASAPTPVKKKGGKLKWILLAIVALIVIIAIANSGGDDKKSGGAAAQGTEASESVPESNLTSGQKNALGAAKNYLEYQAFSRTGLIKQLEFEKYSTEDATFAADNLGADWNEQAAKKAKEYLDMQSFSRQGLIDQLTFEGFTPAEAEYGVSQSGM